MPHIRQAEYLVNRSNAGAALGKPLRFGAGISLHIRLGGERSGIEGYIILSMDDLLDMLCIAHAPVVATKDDDADEDAA